MTAGAGRGLVPPDDSGLPRQDALAERLAAEMSRAWRRGERLPAEVFLASHPEISEHPEAAARVIYEEFCLREGLGQEYSHVDILARFPQWRNQLRLLLECDRWIRPQPAALPPLEPGEVLGDFRVHSRLGRGRRGSVYLATEATLGDRPAVLKLTRPGTGAQEHLTLARLQHAHVIPLNAVHEFPDRGLRALVMPYMGGATLDRVLDGLQWRHPSGRSCADLMRVVDSARIDLAPRPAGGAVRAALAAASYPQAIARVGACMAEAVHAVHSLGLLHLDLKPSNLLIADDGRPFLLDFHLARPALSSGERWPDRLGGTYGYTSPEQAMAMDAMLQGLPIPRPIDARSDIYSLGVTLYEALAGTPPPHPGVRASVLLTANPRAGSVLAKTVARCLALEPDDRYPDALALAMDLRRSLGGLSPMGQSGSKLAGFGRTAWRRMRGLCLRSRPQRASVPESRADGGAFEEGDDATGR